MSYFIGHVNGISNAHGVSSASMPMPPSKKMSALFDRIDTTGSGSISKSQLQAAFATQKPPKAFKAMGADALFSHLDPQGTGSVSKPQFVQTMTSLMSHFRNLNNAAHQSNAGVSSVLPVMGSVQNGGPGSAGSTVPPALEVLGSVNSTQTLPVMGSIDNTQTLEVMGSVDNNQTLPVMGSVDNNQALPVMGSVNNTQTLPVMGGIHNGTPDSGGATLNVMGAVQSGSIDLTA